MDFVLQILLLLIAAKLFGEVVEQTGYPSLIGEIVAGILLGPSILGLVEYNEVLNLFADIGIITLLFISGLSLNQERLMKAKEAALITALAGVAFPFAGGYLLGNILGLSFIESLFIGIALSITSIGVSVRILVDLKKLNTPVGTTIVSAAVLDDIIGILLLGVLSSLALQTFFSLESLVIGMIISLGFLALFVTAGRWALLKIFDAARKTETHEMVYSVTLILALLSAVLSHAAGLHFGIGAFIAGVFLGDRIRSDRILFDSLNDFAFGFFVTLFFASIGVLFSLTAETFLSPLFVPVILIALGGKILGGYLGSLHFLKKPESLMVGLGLCPRGSIELVIAQIALVTGIITQDLFSAIVLMAVVTIILTPVMMKKTYDYFEKRDTAF
jgi:Kef-type K+ transport system membrane component KefB